MKKRRVLKIGLGISLGIAGILLAFRFLTPGVLDGISYSRVVFDRNGEMLRFTLSGDEKYRLPVHLADVNPHFTEALLLLEDQHFYHHPGVNPVSLLRGMKSLARGRDRVGGSTLTMQLARVRYGLRTRKVFGKMAQILTALRLELRHSKREILEAYLNVAPFGGNIEGVEAASQVYFQKSAKELTLAESLLLAVVPQNPNERIGSTQISADAYRARDHLLAIWLKRHPEDRSREANLRLPLNAQRPRELPFRAPHFVDAALRDRPLDPYLHTSLDARTQTRVEHKLVAYVDAHRGLGIKNATALLIDYRTGEIISWVGSKDFFDESIDGQVNGITALRSPGSAVKPFVYALAIQEGLIHPMTLLKDTPRSFGAFDPENFDHRYAGPISAERALIESRNVPAVQLARDIRAPGLYGFLKSAEVPLPKDERFYGLGLTLGGAEMSALDLGRMYSMLARHGTMIPLRYFSGERPAVAKRLLDEESSFLTLEMLSHNPRPDRGYSGDWLRTDYPAAWKTGTSMGFKDAWTVGVIGPYVLVVWLGNFDNEPNPALIGREMAAPLFFEIADAIRDDRFRSPLWKFAEGLNVKKIEVCSVSGHLPGAYCPHHAPTWFIPGRSPITRCAIHQPVLVDRRSGLRSCREPSAKTQLDVFEFWPSDLRDLFELVGINRKAPPAFGPECPWDTRAQNGHAPTIVSPRAEVTYLNSMGARDDLNQIPLRAVADGDAHELFWFANQRFLGKSRPDQSLLFRAAIGDFLVSVVDDLGRSQSRKLTIRASQ